MPQEMITIHPSNMGGSFGAKDYPSLAPAAYHMSKQTGCPVRFVKNYTEELTATSPRHPAVVQLRTGVKKDGRLWAWEGKTFFNGGAYGAYKPNPQGSMSGAYMVAGSYNIPHTLLEGYCVYTNQVPGGYFRAPGETQTLFAVESHIDMMAQAMGIDPLEFRLRNGLKKATRGPLARVSAIPTAPKCSSAWRKYQAGKKPSKEAVKPLKTGRGMALGDRHVGHGDSSFELVLERDGTLRLLERRRRPGRSVLTPCIAKSSPSCWGSIPTRSGSKWVILPMRPTTRGSKARAERISKGKPCCGRPTR